MSSLIDLLTERAPDALVVVAQLVPISYDPAELTAYNNDIPNIAAEKVAQGKHVSVVDLHTNSPGVEGVLGDPFGRMQMSGLPIAIRNRSDTPPNGTDIPEWRHRV